MLVFPPMISFGRTPADGGTGRDACPDPNITLICSSVPLGPSSVSPGLVQPKTTGLKIPTTVYLARRSSSWRQSAWSLRCVEPDDGRSSSRLFWRGHRPDPPVETRVREVDSRFASSPHRRGAFLPLVCRRLRGIEAEIATATTRLVLVPLTQSAAEVNNNPIHPLIGFPS